MKDPVDPEPRPNPDEQRGHAAGAPDEHDLGFDLPPPARLSTARAAVYGLIALTGLGGLFVVGYLPRRSQRAGLAAAARETESAAPRVEVVQPKASSSSRALTLPASVRALQETMVYSRASGYVRKWYVDIGDKVTEGQLLVDLDTPEVDQQLDQARAQLAQAQAAIVLARANRDYSKLTVERYKPLTQQGLTAPQDLDQRQAQASVDEANVAFAQANSAAQEANVRHLAQLKAFGHVTAPFAGTITMRAIEVGTLVTEGNGAAMYGLASSDPARVFVQLPQDVAPSVRAGVPARVTVREYPTRTFSGEVTRASGALDPNTRTMMTEVRVPNTEGALIPGMYAQVSLTLPVPHHVFEIPATSVMNDAKGMRVVVVGDDDKVRLVPIVIERDTGSSYLVSSGLEGTERVVKLAASNFTDGETVDVAPPPAPSASAAASGKPPAR